MKTLAKIFSLFVILIWTVSFSVAQDYKHPYGLTYKKPVKTLPVTNEFTTSNNINYVSGNGSLLHAKSNRIVGRIAKNESFIYYFKQTPAIKKEPNHRCSARGTYFSVLHENYKHPGICGYHCSEWYK